jgi:prophage maintenance system killer protein
MVAQYAFAVGCKQVFIDGTKRTALVVCRASLILHGHDGNASQDEKFTAIMKLANQGIDVGKLAEWIRARLIPAQSSQSPAPPREMLTRFSRP